MNKKELNKENIWNSLYSVSKKTVNFYEMKDFG